MSGVGGTSRKTRIGLVPGFRALNVEVADTKEKHQKGLQNRTDIGDGMLFEYGYPTWAPFWMEQVYVPLTIAFFDIQGNIIDWFDMDHGDHSPVKPSRPYRLVLEVPRGSVVFSLETRLRRNLTRAYLNNSVFFSETS